MHRQTQNGLLALCVAFLIGCDKKAAFEIADVTKPSTNYINAPSNLHAIFNLELRVRGTIDGSAVISGPAVFEVSGKFDQRSGPGDWYQTNFTLKYTPVNVRTGFVRVEYEFGGFSK